MALLPILTAPNPILKQVAVPVAAVDDRIRRLMDDMLETMYDAPGIGLAAPQVGVSERVIVVDVADEDQKEKPQPYCMANPEILWKSDDIIPIEEGCLSVPGQYAEVERPAQIRMTYLDRDGNKQELEAGGMLARCILHEVDHLDGGLFIDYLSALKRNMILRKLKKNQR